MSSAVVILLVCLVGVAVPEPLRQPERIVGGELTTIDNYPFHAGIMFSSAGDFNRFGYRCGGSVINNRSILSAAHCTVETQPINHRFRVGSSFITYDGVVHHVSELIDHPHYNSETFDNDISILRSATEIIYEANIQPVAIAGSNYNVGDNVPVWAIGHGRISDGGQLSQQLRDVQIWTVNQEVCRQRYDEGQITDNMLCSGWLDVGGRDTCQGDSGGPLLDNNVVVGVCSWGRGCAQAYYPGVHTRVSRYTTWIVSNA